MSLGPLGRPSLLGGLPSLDAKRNNLGSLKGAPKLGALGGRNGRANLTGSALDPSPFLRPKSTAPSTFSSSPSSTSSTSLASKRIRPTRLALSYGKCVLGLEYKDLKHDVRRKRQFPIDLTLGLTAESIAKDLAEQYPAYLSRELVSQAQLASLINKLKNQVDLGFSPSPSPSSSPSSTAPLSSTAPQPQLSFPQISSPLQSSSICSSSTTKKEDDVDVNTISDEELARRKKIADEDFEQRRIKPDDPDYVHDRRVDIPVQEGLGEWDMMSSSDEDEDNHIRIGGGDNPLMAAVNIAKPEAEINISADKQEEEEDVYAFDDNVEEELVIGTDSDFGSDSDFDF